MKRKLTVAGLVLAGTVLAELNASAQTLIATTTYNGDTFELWNSPNIYWATAESDAVADGGTLAVLPDSATTTAVYNALIGNGNFVAQNQNSGATQAWIGGYTTAPNFSTTSTTAWGWVDGSPWTAFDASNFYPGEPNGDSDGLAINRYGTDQWNDSANGVGTSYYIEEKVPAPVPDAGSTGSLLLGLAGAMGIVKRKFLKK